MMGKKKQILEDSLIDQSYCHEKAQGEGSIKILKVMHFKIKVNLSDLMIGK